MLYATDGICHNAEPGTFGHECGRPAVWLGTKASGSASGYCATCKADGSEARGVVTWRRLGARGVVGRLGRDPYCAGMAVLNAAGESIYSLGRATEEEAPAYLARFVPGWELRADGAVIGSVPVEVVS